MHSPGSRPVLRMWRSRHTEGRMGRSPNEGSRRGQRATTAGERRRPRPRPVRVPTVGAPPARRREPTTRRDRPEHAVRRSLPRPVNRRPPAVVHPQGPAPPTGTPGATSGYQQSPTRPAAGRDAHRDPRPRGPGTAPPAVPCAGADRAGTSNPPSVPDPATRPPPPVAPPLPSPCYSVVGATTARTAREASTTCQARASASVSTRRSAACR